MPATLSPESRLAETLREIGCANQNFVLIARALGAETSNASFSRAMRDSTKAFDSRLAEKLLDVAARMVELHQSAGVPIAWERTDEIIAILVGRFVLQARARLGLETDERLSQGTAQMIEQVGRL